MTTTPSRSTGQSDEEQTQRILTIIGIALAVFLIGLIVVGVLLAVNAETWGPRVEVVRDYLVVLLSLLLVVIGVAMVVMIVQIARLVLLLNSELTPLIESTSETVNAVRGTAVFLSKYLTDPVIKANAWAAGLASVLSDLDSVRRAVTGKNGGRPKQTEDGGKTYGGQQQQ
ncbi:MAG: hypothetical protein GYB64_00830 [Chloroflexi bacterium]|nr:hypothetical protein [Chloroflexota bacterium]